jgi:glutamyl-tRNA synthetase
MDGAFILRIEDTDLERSTPESVASMLSALAWLGIDWDEGPDIGGDFGPYIQSERHERHAAVVAQLLEQGSAYYGAGSGQTAAASAGQPIFLRVPTDGQTIVHDALRGPIAFQNADLQDKIIVRSDGKPLYHLASMVDDHDMAISHVVRGEEWISSAPYHVQLYRALGWEEPIWIHLPLILNKRGEKLKKRDPEGGYLVSDFQDAGYLPEALWNYLLLLGWTPNDGQELVGKAEVRRQFRIERLSKSPAVFDWDKLNWVNRQYLRRYSDPALANLLRPFLEDAYGPILNEAWLVRLTAVIRDGLNRLADAVELSRWAFEDDFAYTEEARQTLESDVAGPVLVQLVASLARVVVLDEMTAQALLQDLRAVMKQGYGWEAAPVYHTVRSALTGQSNGPPLAEIMAILGAQRVMQRLAAALRDSRP